MIRPTLPERYNNQEDSDFIVYAISLLDEAKINYGVVSYVRMGNPSNDMLNKLIFESIKAHYPLSVLSQTVYKTKETSPEQFPLYGNVARLFIAVKNYSKYDQLYATSYITNGVSLFLDIYNPIAGLAYDEINYFSRENQQAFSNVCDEENNNLETYNQFVQ